MFCDTVLSAKNNFESDRIPRKIKVGGGANYHNKGRVIIFKSKLGVFFYWAGKSLGRHVVYIEYVGVII